MLKDTELAPTFSFDTLALRTQGLSGSDLKEICRNAAMVPMREFMKENGSNPDALAQAQESVSVHIRFVVCVCTDWRYICRGSHYDHSRWTISSRQTLRIL